MSVIVVSPPPTKPSEPAVSAGAAVTVLRRLGVDAAFVDGSIGWHRHALGRARLEAQVARLRDAGAPALPAYRRAIASVCAEPPPLRRPDTYTSRRRYTSAVAHLETALALAASAHDGLRLGVATVGSSLPSERPEASSWLRRFAVEPGPFDDYFEEVLLPEIDRRGAEHLAVSLTFQQQAPAAFRLAHLLRERRPGVVRWLGGPLVACWAAAGKALAGEPFAAFDRVLAGGASDLATLASTAAGRAVTPEATAEAGRQGPLAVPLDDLPWDDYLSPRPVVPAALGTGCYWRHCTFCPDHLHPGHSACAPADLAPWLRSVAARFPGGAMLHLTDSALPPAHLAALADVIHREALPLEWHGFVRIERELADAAFVARLARGGCAMLQLGVETGSARLSRLLGKGTTPELARAVLRACAGAGVRTHVYLLFGVPTETDDDRELTLALVEQEGGSIHAINAALLNLPRASPMHRQPARFGITALVPFRAGTDLSLYDDFRCAGSHPRLEARRWLDRRFFKSPRVRAIGAELRAPLKANHLCFL